MRKSAAFVLLLAIAIVSLAAVARTARKKKPYIVTGTVWSVQDYCGGAAPSDGEQNDTTKARIQKIYLREAGTTNITDSILSDSLGRFAIAVRKGRYEFIEPWKAAPLVMPKNSTYEVWDTACYRRLYQEPDGMVTVTQNMNDVKVVLYRYCAWKRPCCTYSGPLPPVNRGGYQPGHQE